MKNAKDLNKVVGVGPYKGMTRKDFISEINEQRKVMENRNSTKDECENVVSEAGALLIRCDDEEMMNSLILAHFNEMNKRFLWSLKPVF